LKEALVKENPAYYFDEEVVERMAMHDTTVQEQENSDHVAECDTSEERREAEEVCLSWSLMSLLLSHLLTLHGSRSSTKGWRSQSEMMSLSRRAW
jgi:hypothetical protein